jgi:hypothetical protein
MSSPAIRIKLRLPAVVAQDLILRHVRCASEWQQLPFDPSQRPIEIENLDGSFETTIRINCILPSLLDSLLELVSSHGWSERYDSKTAVSVGCAVCAFALESGVELSVGRDVRHSVRRYVPAAEDLLLN